MCCQLDCPDDVASYIHRVGRTARNNTPGKSLLFLTPSEKEMLPALEHAKIPFKLIKVNGVGWDGVGLGCGAVGGRGGVWGGLILVMLVLYNVVFCCCFRYFFFLVVYVLHLRGNIFWKFDRHI